jgi:DNA-binding GntR family transcriptional regulator
MFDSIWNRGISIRSFAAYPIPNNQDNREQHLLLLDQIKTGNVDEAETAMVAHIREGLDNHVRWLHDERH